MGRCEGTSLAWHCMACLRLMFRHPGPSIHRSVRRRNDGRSAMARGNIPNGFFVHFVYASRGALFCSFCRSDMADGAELCSLLHAHYVNVNYRFGAALNYTNADQDRRIIGIAHHVMTTARTYKLGRFLRSFKCNRFRK